MQARITASVLMCLPLSRGSGTRYRHIVSEPLGRSTYKERYLFLYKYCTVHKNVSLCKYTLYELQLLLTTPIWRVHLCLSSIVNSEQTVSVAKNYTYDDGCEPCGTDTFMREPFVVMFSSSNTGKCVCGPVCACVHRCMCLCLCMC